MYMTPTQGYQLLEDLTFHSLEWTYEEEVKSAKGIICSMNHSPQGEVALLLKHQKRLERKIMALTVSLHALEAKQGVTQELHPVKEIEQYQPRMSLEELHLTDQGSQAPKLSLESILETFMIVHANINNNVNYSLMLQKVHMEALDHDVGKIARLLADWYPKEFLEIQTGKAQAITIRSGKEIKSPQMEPKSNDLPILQELGEKEEIMDPERKETKQSKKRSSPYS